MNKITATTAAHLPAPVPERLPAVLAGPGMLTAGTPGLYGWGEELEAVFAGLETMLGAVGRTGDTRVLRFPPVIPRPAFEKSEFATSFAQLFGAVHVFSGDRRAHVALTKAMAQGDDWSDATTLSGFVLTPAACYPVYPLYAGQLAPGGATVDVQSYCFRHEPSDEPGRLVAFRQREFVRIGDADSARAWFAQWQQRATDAVRSLGLPARLEVAADPFFGSGGRLLAASQREQELKFEVLAPIGDHWVAVASCNYHQDHFGRIFGIHTAAGDVAHTTCVGFGQERLAHALVAAHGADLDRWPDDVRQLLWAGGR